MVDLSKVPNLEMRETEARLYEASEAADAAYENAPGKPEVEEKYEALKEAAEEELQKATDAAGEVLYAAQKAAREAFDATVKPLYEAHNKKVDEYDAASAKEQGLDALKAAMQAAQQAYDDHDAGSPVETDEYGKVVRCALSGVPLLEDDEVIVDEETGEKILRCLLLPPRPAEPAYEEDEEQDAA